MTSPTRHPANAAFQVTGPALHAQRTEELVSVGRGVALKLAIIYLFLIFSRVTDTYLSGLHIPGIFFLMAIPAAILCGSLSKLSFSGPLRYLVAFTLWLIAAVPFSVWKGGSAQQVRLVLSALVLFIPIVGLPGGFRDLRKLFFTIAAAVLLFSVMALSSGEQLAGRLATGGGTFANTNDLAQIVLLGVPFVVFLIAESASRPYLAGPAVLGLILMGAALLKTGSRSLVLAVAVMFIIVFFQVSLTAKLRLLFLLGFVIVCAALFLPATVALRFATFFSPTRVSAINESDYMSQLSALESTRERRQLLKDSLIYTVKHPVFGVGPGMFAVARGLDYEKANVTGAWRVTHNAYTQISSEGGIPALIFYLLALGSTFAALRRARRHHEGVNSPVSASIRRAAFALKLAMVSYVVFALFLSIAYQAQMIVLIALAVSLERVSALEREKLAQPGKNVPPPVPTTTPQRFAYSVLPR